MFGLLVEPGDPRASPLYRRVRGIGTGRPMPPALAKGLKARPELTNLIARVIRASKPRR